MRRHVAPCWTMLAVLVGICIDASRRDLYEVLGVERRAGATEIKRAYRRLALQLHPDKHKDSHGAAAEEKTAKFQEVAHAFEVLSNPTKRDNYDMLGDDYDHAVEEEEAEGALRHETPTKPEFRGGVFVTPDGKVIFEQDYENSMNAAASEEETTTTPPPPMSSPPPHEPYPMTGPVVPLTEDNMKLMEQATVSGQVWFIAFHRKACEQCEQLQSAWTDFATRIGEEAVVAAVDIEDESRIASRYNVDDVPQIIAVTSIGSLVYPRVRYVPDRASAYDMEQWGRDVLQGSAASDDTPREEEEWYPEKNDAADDDTSITSEQETEDPDIQSEGERLLHEAEAAHHEGRRDPAVSENSQQEEPSSDEPQGTAEEHLGHQESLNTAVPEFDGSNRNLEIEQDEDEPFTKDEADGPVRADHMDPAEDGAAERGMSQREIEENSARFGPADSKHRLAEDQAESAEDSGDELVTGPDDMGEIWDRIAEGPADGENKQKDDHSTTNAGEPGNERDLPERHEESKASGLESFNSFIDEQTESRDDAEANGGREADEEADRDLSEDHEKPNAQGLDSFNSFIDEETASIDNDKARQEREAAEEETQTVGASADTEPKSASFDEIWKGTEASVHTHEAAVTDHEHEQGESSDSEQDNMSSMDEPRSRGTDAIEQEATRLFSEQPSNRSNDDESASDPEVRLAAEKMVLDAEAVHASMQTEMIGVTSEALQLEGQDVTREAEKLIQQAEAEAEAQRRDREETTKVIDAKPEATHTSKEDDAIQIDVRKIGPEGEPTSENTKTVSVDPKPKADSLVTKVPTEATQQQQIQLVCAFFVTLAALVCASVWWLSGRGVKPTSVGSLSENSTTPAYIYHIPCPQTSRLHITAIAGADGLAQVSTADARLSMVEHGDVLTCIGGVALGYQDFQDTQWQLDKASASSADCTLQFVRCKGLNLNLQHIMFSEFCPCEMPNRVGNNPVELRLCDHGVENEVEVVNGCALYLIPHVSAPQTGQQWWSNSITADSVVLFRGREQPCLFAQHPDGGWAPCKAREK